MPDNNGHGKVSLSRSREKKARMLLGVSDEAGLREIRKAFRDASLKLHPDVNPDDELASRRFHMVCCAYRCLADGRACEELDEVDISPDAPQHDKYQLSNSWGYWCWWREKFFG